MRSKTATVQENLFASFTRIRLRGQVFLYVYDYVHSSNESFFTELTAIRQRRPLAHYFPHVIFEPAGVDELFPAHFAGVRPVGPLSIVWIHHRTKFQRVFRKKNKKKTNWSYLYFYIERC